MIIIIIIIIITITIIVIIIIIIITAVEKCGENGVEVYMIAIVTKPPDTQSPSYKSRQVTAGDRRPPILRYSTFIASTGLETFSLIQ